MGILENLTKRINIGNLRKDLEKINFLGIKFSDIFNDSGLIKTNLLPSYVDDVLEFPDFNSLPEVGETGKIYITTNNGYSFRWTGSIYIEIQTSLENAVIDLQAELNQLAYDLDNIDLSPYQTTIQKNQVDGYAGLNSFGFVDFSILDNTKNRKERFIDTDFNDLGYVNASTFVPYSILNSGTSGAIVDWGATSSEGNIKIQSGTASNGFCTLYQQRPLFISNSNGSTLYYQAGFKVIEASDASQRYEVNFTLGADSVLFASNTLYAMNLTYSDTLNSGKFVFRIKQAGADTTINTNITFVANTNYDFKIKITSNTMYVYLNDSLIHTEITNIPYNQSLKNYFGIKKSIGTTNRSLQMNYQKIYKIYSAKRF